MIMYVDVCVSVHACMFCNEFVRCICAIYHLHLKFGAWLMRPTWCPPPFPSHHLSGLPGVKEVLRIIAHQSMEPQSTPVASMGAHRTGIPGVSLVNAPSGVYLKHARLLNGRFRQSKHSKRTMPLACFLRPITTASEKFVRFIVLQTHSADVYSMGGHAHRVERECAYYIGGMAWF